MYATRRRATCTIASPADTRLTNPRDRYFHGVAGFTAPGRSYNAHIEWHRPPHKRDVFAISGNCRAAVRLLRLYRNAILPAPQPMSPTYNRDKNA
jgi:hypothetical protein